MHRIDTPGNVSGQFTDGNPYGSPATGGTIVGAAWANDVQENLAQAIEGAGLTLEKGNGAQLLDAIRALAADYFYRGREMIAQARTNVAALDLFGIGSPTVAGTNTAASASGADGPTSQVETINHAGGTPETIGWTWAFDLTKRSWIPDLEGTIELGFASNCRLWFGLVSAAIDQLSDPAAISSAAFRFDYAVDAIANGGDGTLKSVTSSGSGSIVKSTGIAFNAVQRYRLRVRRDSASSALFRFYVDGVEVTQHQGSSGDPVPASSTAIGPVAVMRHLSDTQAKSFRLGWLRLRSK